MLCCSMRVESGIQHAEMVAAEVQVGFDLMLWNVQLVMFPISLYAGSKQLSF